MLPRREFTFPNMLGTPGAAGGPAPNPPATVCGFNPIAPGLAVGGPFTTDFV